MGITYPAHVNSYIEEFDLKMASSVKGIAVNTKLLDGLFCEADLVIAEKPKLDDDLSANLVMEAALARGAVKGFLEYVDKASDAEI